MVPIVLLLIVLGYANAVDSHGSTKVEEFWGGHAARDEVLRADYVITPQTVQRFGVRLGGDR
jgi:hypothetical protein